MTICLNGKEYCFPPLTASTLRKLKRVSGVPMAEMDPFMLMQSMLALSACVSLAEAGDIWGQHRDRYGPDETNKLICDMADDLTAQVKEKTQWLYRRSPAVRNKWLLAFNEGR